MDDKRVACSRSRYAVILIAGALAIVNFFVAATPAWGHPVSNPDRLRHHIKKRARSQIGASYVYGGSSPSGFDCSGFTKWVFANHGAALPHSALAQFHLGAGSGFKRIWKRRKLKVGDLVFHKTTSARVGHAGVYVGHGRFISATTSGGVRPQSVWDPYYWGGRWVGGTRLPVLIRDAS